MLNRLNLTDKIMYQCEFEAHPRGAFLVGDKRYRPFWPVAPINREENEVRKMVLEAVDILRNFHHETSEYFERVRVLRFKSGRTRVLIDQI